MCEGSHGVSFVFGACNSVCSIFIGDHDDDCLVEKEPHNRYKSRNG